jgi:integrase
LRETKRGLRTACRLAGIEGLIWKGRRLELVWPKPDADAFTIAQLLGHSDVRVTMRYVRAVEDEASGS